ncbi:DUF3310 domain-containing protein [Virgibacillus halophilus]|uniref:DUF3310 domain-containing protein n=1 Tax=Tigheibacillus halophilus TaxID=361280 RepID=A0ABU5C632_9BACI|nr:DUF3310 domain-containing protein [Virgibacillus halophilus]
MNHIEKPKTRSEVINEHFKSVNHPSHYQGKTEVIDIIDQAVDGLSGSAAFNRGNAVKYIMRAGKKGTLSLILKKQFGI